MHLGVTPRHDQPWMNDRVMKWSLALILWLLCLPVHLSGCSAMSKFVHYRKWRDGFGRSLDVSVHSLSGQPHETFHIHSCSSWGHTVVKKAEWLECGCYYAMRECLLCMWIWLWTWHQRSHLHLCLCSAAWVFSPFSCLGLILVLPR